MDSEAHVAAPLLDQVGEFAGLVLGLRDGEAIARHHHHLLGIGDAQPRVFGGDRAISPPAPETPPASATAADPKAPKKTFENERFIALLMMSERMKPERPSSAPTMIRMLLSMAKPCRDGRQAGIELRRLTTTACRRRRLASPAARRRRG